MKTIYMKKLPLKETIKNLKRDIRNLSKKIDRARQATSTNPKVVEAKRIYELAYNEAHLAANEKVEAILQEQSILDKEIDRLTDELKNQEARKLWNH